MTVKGVIDIVSGWPFIIGFGITFLILSGWAGISLALRIQNGFSYKQAWKREIAETMACIALGLFLGQYLA